jgi:hypothetical protein
MDRQQDLLDDIFNVTFAEELSLAAHDLPGSAA